MDALLERLTGMGSTLRLVVLAGLLSLCLALPASAQNPPPGGPPGPVAGTPGPPPATPVKRGHQWNKVKGGSPHCHLAAGTARPQAIDVAAALLPFLLVVLAARGMRSRRETAS